MTDVRDTKLRARVECCLALPLAHGGVTCLCREMVVCERAGSARRSAGSVVFVFVCGRRERRHDDHSQRLHSRQSTRFPAGDVLRRTPRQDSGGTHASSGRRSPTRVRSTLFPFGARRRCVRVCHTQRLVLKSNQGSVRRQQPLAAHLRPPACAAEPEAIYTPYTTHTRKHDSILIVRSDYSSARHTQRPRSGYRSPLRVAPLDSAILKSLCHQSMCQKANRKAHKVIAPSIW